jgi:hypothetical protein
MAVLTDASVSAVWLASSLRDAKMIPAIIAATTTTAATAAAGFHHCRFGYWTGGGSIDG